MTMVKTGSVRPALSAKLVSSLSSHDVENEFDSSAHDWEDAGTDADIRRASLEELEAMDARGELYHNPDAPEGPDLPDSFWENAVLVEPPKTRSVHLKIDAEVFHHFLAETGGKGHITRMQAVLKSYVKAQQAAAAKRLAKG